MSGEKGCPKSRLVKGEFDQNLGFLKILGVFFLTQSQKWRQYVSKSRLCSEFGMLRNIQPPKTGIPLNFTSCCERRLCFFSCLKKQHPPKPNTQTLFIQLHRIRNYHALQLLLSGSGVLGFLYLQKQPANCMEAYCTHTEPFSQNPFPVLPLWAPSDLQMTSA